MNLINTILGVPLGYIIYFAYSLTGNFAISVIIFAFIVRVILLPVNIITHKNSIRLLQLQPQLNKIKRQYSGDKERQNEAQSDLFHKNKYNPFIGILPLVIQLFILLGVLQVMYNPMQHLLHLDTETITAYTQTVRDIHGQFTGAGEQLFVLQSMQLADLSIFGINSGAVPSLSSPSIELIVPALSAISALIYCLVQNMYSPGALSQSKKTNMLLTVITVIFSLYFTMVTPIGVGIYWTLANIFSIGVIFTLEALYSPKKLALQAIEEIRKTQKTPAQVAEEKAQKRMLRQREKEDVARWNVADKKLVFYALSGGQYKYYKATIDYLLAHSSITIHYLTNDPDDKVFELHKSTDKFIPYYASEQKTISLMLNLDADVMVTTVQDLQIYHMKRSIVRRDIEYIHIPHGPASLHMTAKENAYDYFDTFFCTGLHQVRELQKREEMAGLPKKKLVKAGYGLYDVLSEQYMQINAAHKSSLHEDGLNKPRILIAPSWQDECILDLCVDTVLESLFDNGWVIYIRPHPQFVRIFPERLQELEEQYANRINSGELILDFSFSSVDTVLLSDLLITDWSGIAFEFSYCTLKPSVFINTPMKVLNPNYTKYDIEVTDITLRDKVGVSIDVDKVNTISDTIKQLLAGKDAYKKQIQDVISEYLYYPGRSGEAGGKYIMGKFLNEQR